MKDENTLFEKMNNWIRGSVTLKLITITILMLLLLIPASMITSVIIEREDLNNQAISEVSSKWAENQLIAGPILTIPIIYEEQDNDKKVLLTRYYNILPEELKITGEIKPLKLKRGIYEVVVYQSDLAVSGNFALSHKIDLENIKEIQFHKSFITIGISDLRGIKDHIVLSWNNQYIKAKPGSRISNTIYSGVTFDLPDVKESIGMKTDFHFDLNLQGSQNMSFAPIGNTTEVNIESTWPNPSFNGNFLPDSREVTEEGFTASWRILQLNRNFPQSWIGTEQSDKINDSAFGVNLILSLDDYQKSIRSAKYAVMTIALTFLIFFLVEVMNRRKIHPFQYALVGLALCLFYILLVSISEHLSFNLAYIISTFSIVTMISLYSLSVFKEFKLSTILVATLVGIYGFIFVTLQLVDYALLLGSIGITIILGLTMYFTRNINWYGSNIQAN